MNMTIRRKMILILIASTITPLCFVGMLGYYHARNTLESLRIEGLKSIADLKANRIEDFFADQKKHITVAQHRPTLKRIASVIGEFEGEFEKSGIRNKLENDTSQGTAKETLARFIEQFEPFLSDNDVLRIMTHRAKQKGEWI